MSLFEAIEFNIFFFFLIACGKSGVVSHSKVNLRTKTLLLITNATSEIRELMLQKVFFLQFAKEYIEQKNSCVITCHPQAENIIIILFFFVL